MMFYRYAPIWLSLFCGWNAMGITLVKRADLTMDDLLWPVAGGMTLGLAFGAFLYFSARDRT